MIASNAEFTLNLYYKRKPRPLTQSFKHRPGHSQPKMRGALNRSRQLYGKTTVPAPKFLFIEPANTPFKSKKAMNYVPAGRNCQKEQVSTGKKPKKSIS
jgi:hypothetical protein